MNNLVNNIIAVQDATFEAEVLKSDLPVLVDFWAEWCGPCRSIAPILHELAQEYAGRLKVVKVNVDENSVFAGRYNVRGIPALLFFKEGELVETKMGALPKGQLAAFIDSNI